MGCAYCEVDGLTHPLQLIQQLIQLLPHFTQLILRHPVLVVVVNWLLGINKINPVLDSSFLWGPKGPKHIFKRVTYAFPAQLTWLHTWF